MSNYSKELTRLADACKFTTRELGEILGCDQSTAARKLKGQRGSTASDVVKVMHAAITLSNRILTEVEDVL